MGASQLYLTGLEVEVQDHSASTVTFWGSPFSGRYTAGSCSVFPWWKSSVPALWPPIIRALTSFTRAHSHDLIFFPQRSYIKIPHIRLRISMYDFSSIQCPAIDLRTVLISQSVESHTESNRRRGKSQSTLTYEKNFKMVMENKSELILVKIFFTTHEIVYYKKKIIDFNSVLHQNKLLCLIPFFYDVLEGSLYV